MSDTGADPMLDLAVLVEDIRWEKAVPGGRPAVDELVALAVNAAIMGADEGDAALSLAVVLTDDAQVADLNKTYRGKDGSTNVLSFAARDAGMPPLPDGPDGPEALGDVILAMETCWREAEDQGTAFRDHLCHLIVHGVLHLLGYDHQDDAEAEDMERLETEVLAGLGIADPYAPMDVGPPADVGGPDETPPAPVDER